MRLRRARPPVEVAAGEQVLASAAAPAGAVAGTRDALYLPGGRRIPWEQVEAADWDLESETLTCRRGRHLGAGRARRTPSSSSEPGRLLQLVRERVTASVVLQRHVAVLGRRGVRVIARRAPTGSRDR